MGLTSEQCDINHVRLCKEHIDLGDENHCSQLDDQIGEAAKTAPPHLWSSIPCTSGSPWQYINRKKGGAAFMKRLARQLCESKCLFKSFSRRAELVRWYCFFRVAQTLNWMETCSLMLIPQFLEDNFDGCAVGLRSKAGNPIKKPWRVRTTSQRIYDAFHNKVCSCTHEHERYEGAETARSAVSCSDDAYY